MFTQGYENYVDTNTTWYEVSYMEPSWMFSANAVAVPLVNLKYSGNNSYWALLGSLSDPLVFDTWIIMDSLCYPMHEVESQLRTKKQRFKLL